MKLSDFDYHLPPERIAQYPSQRREEARLMVVDRASGRIEHRLFLDLPRQLSDRDLLVLNQSRVFPARLFARRPNQSERIEVLLVHPAGEKSWEVLARPGRKLRPGTRLLFAPGRLEALVEARGHGALWRLQFDVCRDFWGSVEELGETPLPPYIRRPPEPDDRRRYQTVFARVRGSVAAPTAGLHFTRRLLSAIPHCAITLHVGYGTFQPVTTSDIRRHRMEPEYYRISPAAARRIRCHQEAGGRLIAVGTTAARTLEHVTSRQGRVVAGEGWTDLFIYPGYRFRAVEGLITNFHLPGSTLLMLVAAFAGRELIRNCYEEAIRRDYRFYSYGDAMLIL